LFASLEITKLWTFEE